MTYPSSWNSLYEGGEGDRLSVTTSSANIPVPGANTVNQMLITNLGDVLAFVKVGAGSDLTATLNCFPLSPGYSLPLPIEGYVAAITEADSTTLLINTGNGATT